MKYNFLQAGNFLYKYAYPLYLPLYKGYKIITERAERKVFKSSLMPGMTALDIGANIGIYSQLFSKLVGKDGKVYSFEPDSLNFQHLKENTQNLRNVIINEIAVGERCEKLGLYFSDSLNTDHHTFDNGDGRSFSEIDSVNIDSYFRNEEMIDFIKVDVQGYDYYAVKGMKETIRRSDNVIIFGELWPYALGKAGSSAAEYLGLLRDFGFVLKICGEELSDYDRMKDDWGYYTNFIGKKVA